MSIEDKLEYWKNEPDESPYKRIYDEHKMDFSDFLQKHYSDEKYLKWSRWSKWSEWVAAAFDEQKFKEFKKRSGYYYISAKHSDFKKSLEELDINVNLPDDLKKLIAFLQVDGFFKYYKLNVSDWLSIQNYQNPESEIKSKNPMTILQLASTPEELNYLRDKLVHLKWWDITRGDPQGG